LLAACLLATWSVAVPFADAQTGPTEAPLVLEQSSLRLDLWPGVKVLSDPGGQLDVSQAAALAPRFETPRTAYATLGLRREAVWLRVPFGVSASAASQWILDIGSSGLNRIDAYVLRGTRITQQALLGTLRNDPEHPRAARTHAMTLQLEPGQSYELLLRVETDSAMLVPLSLNTPETFLARALREQFFQGVILSMMACIVLYSLTLWLSLRDVLFLKYTLIVLGGFGFALGQLGIGAQYLWGGSRWMMVHAGTLSGICSAAGFFLFFEHALAEPGRHRVFGRVMKVGAVACLVLAIPYASGFLTTRGVGIPLSVLSLSPSLMSLPLALRRMRRGDPMGIYFVLAVLVYFIATATMAGVVYGRVPVNFWTHHSIQLSSLLDALLLGRLLSLRMHAAQRQAQHAALERDAMRSLAHTDPLTGLPNRRGLHNALALALPMSGATQLVAVFVIDLDGFKPVNDQYGHDVGDELLVAVAGRLQNLVRTHDVVARVGGDEFVIMVTRLGDSAQAHDMGQKFLDAFRAPFQLTHQRCQVGLTIGYALAPLDGSDANALLKLADAGMYAGKSAGKHCLNRIERRIENSSA
jgi:diguanylate cyclase (GGDEF)-like protein